MTLLVSCGAGVVTFGAASWTADQWSRLVGRLLHVDDYRALLRFTIDDPGDDEAGALVGYVQHWSGKQEHKSISEQTHRARAALVKMGHAWVGCKAPYGLRWRFETIQHHDGRVDHNRIGWDADPAESSVVAGLFAGLLAGKTLRGMARDLTERGVLSPRAVPAGHTAW